MAMVLEAALSSALKLLAQLAEDEVAMLFGLSADIKELQATMADIQHVLADAENSCASSETVAAWLRELKDFMYDADDILDLCNTDFNERRAGAAASSCCAIFLRDPVAAHKIGRRIKKLNARFDAINKRRSRLGLQAAQSVDRPRLEISFVGRETSPVENETAGEKIEADTRKLVEMLTRKDQESMGDPYAVVAVVGAGGIGKTTLAKKVFNHPIIEDEFEKRAWVYIPQELTQANALNLLHTVINQLGCDHGGVETKAELQPILEQAVAGRKVLMVLDDMWSVEAWEALLVAPLRRCVPGSWIIVTTRNVEIGLRMKAVCSHLVTKLSGEDGWTLLKKQVVTLSKDIMEVERLSNIGKKIVERCEGLPLAISTLGGVLRTKKKTESAWQRVLESSVWSRNGLPEDINKAVYLSYEDLPSHLRQCFLYCSLIPKGRHINRGLMSQYWIAEGFVVPNQSSDLLEEIGEDYFRELVSRNLLEPINYFYDEYNCEMHDVIRCFAQYLIKEEAVFEGYSLTDNTSLGRVRRLILSGDTWKLDQLRKLVSVRTLISYYRPQDELKHLTAFMSRLRVIDLTDCSIDTLPESVYRLKHLRYLDVSGTNIDTILPSIKNLRTLQYLNLSSCKMLMHLPDTIVELTELRGLGLWASSVQYIPGGLEKLQNLAQLSGFTPMQCGAAVSSGLDAITALKNLALFSSSRLESASISDSSSAILSEKPHLRYLILECTSMVDKQGKMTAAFDDADVLRVEDVFTKLQPPTCLEYLNISGFFGVHLPYWLSAGSAFLPNLMRLDLANLPCCVQLPSLGLLPNLNYLSIERAVQVENVGPEFLAGDESTPCAFPKLDTMSLKQMERWREWHWDEWTCAMLNLQNLIIRHCKLRSLPLGLQRYAKALTRLSIDSCPDITCVNGLFALKILNLRCNPALERITNLPALQTLKIWQCSRVTVLEDLPLLRYVKLEDYMITDLPGWLSTFRNLSKLELYCTPELLKLIAQQDGGPEWHKIKHIRQVKALAEDASEHFNILYVQEPYNFSTNVVH